jgi:hypothetical protein
MQPGLSFLKSVCGGVFVFRDVSSTKFLGKAFVLRNICCLIPLLVCFFVIGCSTSHPGNWTQAEIEAYLLKTENPKMSEVKINADPAGGYTGTGKSPDGESFRLTIKQNADLKKLSWNAKGDRGTVIEDGSYEFVK